MQKIVPHLWFDREAKEAAEFYNSVFPESRINYTTLLHNTPSGDSDIVVFEIWNQEFMAINAGPLFKFNPSISFIVNYDPLLFGSSLTRDQEAREKLDRAWEKLTDGGKILMPLDEYPFSKHYGWVQDKYGVSWQLILTNPEGEQRPAILPSLLFVGDKCGKAEEAINFYVSVFKNSRQGAIFRYDEGQEPDKPGTVMFADGLLEDIWLTVADSAHKHNFDFNEAISLLINCTDQAEIDYYWEKLSAVPEAEQCGWLKDKYGVSWQISTAVMEDMFRNGTQEQIDRVTQAFLPMKKLDIQKLNEAYNGNK